MKIMILIALMISSTTLSAFAESPTAKAFLKNEIKKDLAGKKSCFKGALRKKRNDMDDNYGGRFSPDEAPNLNVAEGSSTQYRYIDKYCDDLGNGLQSCASTDTSEYLVAIQFTASTTGTFEVESVDFRVVNVHKSILIINDKFDSNPENGDEGLVSSKQEDKWACTPIR